jgi:hypothetical protein
MREDVAEDRKGSIHVMNERRVKEMHVSQSQGSLVFRDGEGTITEDPALQAAFQYQLHSSKSTAILRNRDITKADAALDVALDTKDGR